MQPLRDDIAEWCDETWGQNPLEVLEWFEDDERVQVFIKLHAVFLLLILFSKKMLSTCNEIELKSDIICTSH